MIRHPARKPVLFDTGYAPHFRTATARWPYRLYACVTPVTLGTPAVQQLRRMGLHPQDLEEIVLSHFHADHTGGLPDFPGVPLRYLEAAWTPLRGLRGFGALRRGFLPDLLPADFARRSRPIPGAALSALPPGFAPLSVGVDLYGDGSVWGVPLPGHARAQMGLLLRLSGGDLLLGADAAWSLEGVRWGQPPGPLAKLIFDSATDYQRSFAALSDLHARRPGLRMLFAHDPETARLAGETLR
nr:MBL fold metallo-hydrolase [Deinobacterium chartae]